MARGKDMKIEQLANVRLFSECSKKDLTMIGKLSDEQTVEAGKVVVEQGATGVEFFLILEGEAVVRRNGRKTATLSEGKYFGELALLSQAPRNASVVASTDMRLLVIRQRQFKGLLDEVPGINHKLLASMAERIREYQAKAAEV